MNADDALEKARGTVAVVGELIKAAGDNPNVRAAGDSLGRSALVLAKTINNALLPLAAVNFAFDKARAYFDGKFQEDIAEKTSAIPPENIVDPKASIAGPSLQGLAFAHEEPNLKNMYLSLLATAMDGRVSAGAHPAFVEIIKQLDAEEAGIIKEIILSPTALPIIQVHTVDLVKPEFQIAATHVMNYRNDGDPITPVENSRVPAMVDNWVRLGLVQVSYERALAGPEHYTWVEARPEVIAIRLRYAPETRRVEIRKGVLTCTNLGMQFGAAVGLIGPMVPTRKE